MATTQIAKLAGKVERKRIVDLKVSDTLNVRFHKGAVLNGVTIEKDSLDLPTLKASIIDLGGIVEPIWVSEQANKDLLIIRGNRRYFAGCEVYNDPNTLESVKQSLENVPVLVYKGLTPEQEEQMVQDQNSKPYLRSEMARHIFKLLSQGWTWKEIAAANYEKFASQSGKQASIMKEIREIPESEPAARAARIETWLKGTIKEYYENAFKMGPRVMKAVMLSEMLLDGLLTATMERPEWITTSNPQQRMLKLMKARNTDGDAYSAYTGGPEFNKVVADFQTNDAKPKGDKSQDKGEEKALTRTASLAQSEQARSRLATACFKNAAGDETPDLFDLDDIAAQFDAKKILWEAFLVNVNQMDDLRRTLITLCLNGHVDEFNAYLIANK
jgi:hypothetical protein